jgi:hypothetical protein
MKRPLHRMWPLVCVFALVLVMAGPAWPDLAEAPLLVGMAAPLGGDNADNGGDNGDGGGVLVVTAVVTNTPSNTVIPTITPPAPAVPTPIGVGVPTPIGVGVPSPKPLATVVAPTPAAAALAAQPKPVAVTPTTPSPRAGGFPMELAPLFVGGLLFTRRSLRTASTSGLGRRPNSRISAARRR